MASKQKILMAMGACAIICAGILYSTRDRFGGHLYEGCHWVDMRRSIVISDKPYYLKFRAQKCNDPYLKMSYKVDGQRLLEFPVGHPDKAIAKTPKVIVQFWPYDPKTFKDKISEINVPTLNPDEQNKCEVVFDSKNKTYGYQPKEAYMKRMLAKNEPFEACGHFGYNNDKTAFFKIIDEKALAFFDVGQEAPLYVPHSFHLVRR